MKSFLFGKYELNILYPDVKFIFNDNIVVFFAFHTCFLFDIRKNYGCFTASIIGFGFNVKYDKDMDYVTHWAICNKPKQKNKELNKRNDTSLCHKKCNIHEGDMF